MWNQGSSKGYKVLLTFVSLSFVFSTFAYSLIYALPAKAQTPVTDVSQTSAYISLETNKATDKKVTETKSEIFKKLKDNLLQIGAVALKRLAVKLTQSITDSFMTYLETGDWGQSPVWEQKTWEAWSRDLGGKVLGEVMAELSTAGPWANYFDICEPSLDVKLAIFRSVEAGSKGDPFDQYAKNRRCSFDNVKKNYEKFYSDLRDKYVDNIGVASFVTVDQVLKGFEPQQSEVGQFIMSYDLLNTVKSKKEEDLKGQRVEGQGYKPEGGDITGETQTNPPGTSKKLQEENIEKTTDATQQETSAAYQTLQSIPAAIGSTFLNSVVSGRMVEALVKAIQRGYASKSDTKNIEGFDDYTSNLDKQLSKIKRVNFSFNQKEVDLLTNYVNCPRADSTSQKNVDNCVMDEDFADAVRQNNYGDSYSVEQAYFEGLLADRAFKDDRADRIEDCQNQAYCYSNLVKLRKARIIPIGWELAAQQAGSREDITLSFLMNCFNAPEGDNACDGFQKLVDPDWILKYPKTLCDAEAYGPILTAVGTDDRMNYCADLKSCVDENEDGSCNHYAYCAAEKNVWRFGGKECPGYYDSCTTVENRDGKTSSYILNTVDYDGCSADNVGCKAYSTWIDDAQENVAQPDWLIQYPDNYYNGGTSMVYLNSKIEDQTCDARSEGCSRVISMDSEMGANLVPNSDFDYFEGEVDDTDSDIILGWNYGGTPAVSYPIVEDAYGAALKIDQTSGQVTLSKPISVVPKKYGKYYYFRAEVKAPSGANVSLIPQVHQIDGTLAVAQAPTDVLTDESSVVNPLTTAGIVYASEEINPGEWTAFEKVVRVAPNTAYLNILIEASQDVLVDRVLVTEVPAPNEVYNYSKYHEKAYDFVKVSPDYNACYDSVNSITGSNENMGDLVADDGTSTITKWYTPYKTEDIFNSNLRDGFADAPACDDYAKLCSAEEVDCDFYQSNSGGLSVAAVASPEDACPKACVGYETYSQRATDFADAEFPLYLIPDSADQCSAAAVGCEEFTNLDALAAGGEAREYYQNIRLCLKTDDPVSDGRCGIYYSWVGTDLSGYQLQTFYLEKDGSEPKNTNLVQTEIECNETNYNPNTFPECRQLVDNAGGAHYVVIGNTVKCSQDCQPFRRTLQYDNASQCTDRGGVVDGDNCNFWFIPNESKSCNAQNAGCRAYDGNTSADVQVLMADTFDNESGNIPSNWSAGNLSTESQVNGGKSIKMGTGFEAETTITLPYNYMVGEQYIVDFWAEGDLADADVSIYLGPSVSVDLEVTDSFGADVNFLHYTSDVLIPNDIGNEVTITVQNGLVYFDTFKFTRLSDVRYLILNTWETPIECNQDNQGRNLPQAQLGCDEYSTNNKDTEYVKSFRNACRSEAVGCQAFIDTGNTASPFSEGYNVEYIDPCTLAKENGDIGTYDNCTDDIISAMNTDWTAALQTEYENCEDLATTYSIDENGELGDFDYTAQLDDLISSGGFATAGSAVVSAYSTMVENAEAAGVTGTAAEEVQLPSICNQFPDLPQCTVETIDEDVGFDFGADGLLGDSATVGGVTYDSGTAPLVLAGDLGYDFSDSLYGLFDFWSGYGMFYVDDSEVKVCQENLVARAYCESQFGYEWQGGRCVVDDDQYVTMADHMIYMVVNDEVKCDKSQVGCTMVGLPELNQDFDIITEVELEALGSGSQSYIDNLQNKEKTVWDKYYYLINPDEIESKLCVAEENRCEEYITDNGRRYYFRDPGARTCQYRSVPQVTGLNIEGWFRKDVYDEDGDGDKSDWVQCTNLDEDVEPIDVTKDVYHDGFEHMLPSNAPGYNQYQTINEGTSEEVTIEHSGWVGECRSTFDGCTAFVDPVDVAGGASGKAYYYINDEDIEDCTGISEKNGCLLFNDTSIKDANGNVILNSSAAKTYDYSREQNNVGVAPQEGYVWGQALIDILVKDHVICTDHVDYECDDIKACFNSEDVVDVNGNFILDEDHEKLACAAKLFTDDDIGYSSDPGTVPGMCSKEGIACYTLTHSGWFDNANRAIKVKRDRVCDQWYDCVSGETVINPQTNNEEFICYSLGLCDQVSETGTGANKCANFIEEDPLGEDDYLLNDNKIFDYTKYYNRNTDWNSLEYSGYSISGQYPLQYYQSFDVNSLSDGATDSDYRLVHTFVPPTENGECEEDADCENVEQGLTDNVYCVNNTLCVSSIRLGQPLNTSSDAECRGYPRADSPYPKYSQDNDNPQRSVYENVNVSEATRDGNEKFDTGCLYKKVTFGNGILTKYFPRNFGLSDLMPEGKEGYCQDDPDMACTCNGESDDPAATGTRCNSSECSVNNNEMAISLCLKPDIDDIEEYVGWQGYCLERDYGTPSINGNPATYACQTWYPLDSMSGLANIYNNYEDAAYEGIKGNYGVAYCANAVGNKDILGDDFDDITQDDYKLTFATEFDENGFVFDYREEFRGWISSEVHDDPYHDDVVLINDLNLYKEDIAYVKVNCISGQDGDWCDVGDINEINFYQAQPFDKNNPSTSGFRMDANFGDLSSYRFYDAEGNLSDDYANWTYYEMVWIESGDGTTYSANAPQGTSDNYDYRGDKSPYSLQSSNVDKKIIFMKDYCDGSYCHDYMTGVKYPRPAEMGSGGTGTDYAGVRTGTGDGDFSVVACSSDSDCGKYGTYDADLDYDGNGVVQCINGACTNQKCEYPNESDYDNDCTGDDCVSPLYQAIIDAGSVCNHTGDSGDNVVWSCSSDNWCTVGGLSDSASLSSVFDATTKAKAETQLDAWCNPQDSKSPFKDSDENYLGVRFLFDETGKWRGIWSAICDDSSNDGWQEMTFEFGLNEYCTDLVNVYDDVTQGSKAMMQRLYHTYYNNKYYSVTPTYRVGAGTEYAPLGSSENYGDFTAPYYIKRLANDFNDMTEPGGSDYTKYDKSEPDYPAGSWGGKPYACSGASTFVCDSVTKFKGISALKDMFAKAYASKEYDKTAESGDKYSNGDVWDFSDDTEYAHPPIIAAPITPNNPRLDPYTGAIVKEAVVGKFSVNGVDSGDVFIPSGQAVVEFYAWAADNQMPIVKPTVDFGDGTTVGMSGKYKNHKPVCQAEENEKLGLCHFGNEAYPGYACRIDQDCQTQDDNGDMVMGVCYNYGKCADNGKVCRVDAECEAGKEGVGECQYENDASYDADRFGDTVMACESQDPFAYQNRYRCDGPQSVCSGDNLIKAKIWVAWYENGQEGTEPDKPTSECFCADTDSNNCWAPYTGACQWVPRVQVLDNWGWCNGSCVTDPDWVSGGCYDGSDSGDSNQCDTQSVNTAYKNKHWLTFDGRILVKPE